MITLNDVRGEVRRIDAMKADDETAHSAEDALYADVLEYYASGGTDKELAIEALKTREIKFYRWCA